MNPMQVLIARLFGICQSYTARVFRLGKASTQRGRNGYVLIANSTYTEFISLVANLHTTTIFTQLVHDHITYGQGRIPTINFMKKCTRAGTLVTFPLVIVTSTQNAGALNCEPAVGYWGHTK
jgi:hypothetical protein